MVKFSEIWTAQKRRIKRTLGVKLRTATRPGKLKWFYTTRKEDRAPLRLRGHNFIVHDESIYIPDETYARALIFERVTHFLAEPIDAIKLEEQRNEEHISQLTALSILSESPKLGILSLYRSVASAFGVINL